jgi:predicted DNA-binding ribbon-helix-helix protein
MGLSTAVGHKLRRLARQRECSLAALVERLATNEESRVTGSLKRKGGQAALKRYYDGK